MQSRDEAGGSIAFYLEAIGVGLLLALALGSAAWGIVSWLIS